LGIIAAFALLGAFVAGAIPGIASTVAHALARRRGRGSWLLFFGLAAVAAAAVATLAVLVFQSGPEPGSGPPSAEDFEALIAAAALLGASPGLGLSAGVLACLKRSGD
jgi:hypothetical protein